MWFIHLWDWYWVAAPRAAHLPSLQLAFAFVVLTAAVAAAIYAGFTEDFTPLSAAFIGLGFAIIWPVILAAAAILWPGVVVGLLLARRAKRQGKPKL